MKIYYLHTEKGQEGPFDFNELKEKKVTRETPIWYEELDEWTIAGKVDELKELFKTVPPPFKKELIQTRDSTRTKPQNIIDSKAEVKNKSRKNLLGKVIIVGLILLVCFFLYNMLTRSYESGDSYQEKKMTVEEIEKANPTNFLSVTGSYKQNFWGNKLVVNGTINNKATVATYKDAIVRVTYYSKTNTPLANKDYTIYEIFTPTSTKEFELKVENYSDISTIGLDIISAINI